jgi:hypothetical protein
MSGRRSSQRTWPLVARSMDGQRSAGTMLDFHCEIACGVTPNMPAMRSRPIISMAFEIAFMRKVYLSVMRKSNFHVKKKENLSQSTP